MVPDMRLVRLANYITNRYHWLHMVTPTEPIPMARDDACNIVVDGRAYCIDPLEGALQLIGKRWVLLVIGILGNYPEVRFTVAKKAIPGISARALSSALSELQARDLVLRTVDSNASPPAVSYSLTPAGMALRAALVPLIEWSEEYPPADGL